MTSRFVPSVFPTMADTCVFMESMLDHIENPLIEIKIALENELFATTHVWVRVELHRPLLARPYSGTYLVLDRQRKYFTLATYDGVKKSPLPSENRPAGFRGTRSLADGTDFYRKKKGVKTRGSPLYLDDYVWKKQKITNFLFSLFTCSIVRINKANI